MGCGLLTAGIDRLAANEHPPQRGEHCELEYHGNAQVAKQSTAIGVHGVHYSKFRARHDAVDARSSAVPCCSGAGASHVGHQAGVGFAAPGLPKNCQKTAKCCH